MIKFYDILLLIGLSGGLILCSILLIRKSSNDHLAKLLASSLLLITLYFIIYELLLTRLILEVPMLYSFAFPFYYLIPPVCYLYVKSKVKDRNKFQALDFLHFLPALFAVLDLIPFYLQPAEVKAFHVLSLSKDITQSHTMDMGFLKPSIHFHARLAQALVYLTAQILVLVRHLRNRTSEARLPKPLFKWLSAYTSLIVLIYINLFVITLDVDMHIADHKRLSELNGLPMTLIAFSFLGIVLYLFFSPEILYGIEMNVQSLKVERGGEVISFSIPENQETIEEELVPEKEQALLSPEQLSAFIKKLESQLEQRELFREQKLVITVLAAKVNIAPRTLSYILNSHYEKRFTDFINEYRVNYVISRFNMDDWRGMTLEGLAYEAGFSSRSTFFSAFKKATGCSPSEYLEQRTTHSVA